MAKMMKYVSYMAGLLSLTVLSTISLAGQRGDRGTALDSVIRPASLRYDNLGFLKRIILGKNYREEWATPVKMPVFDLKTVQGGFTIQELGGGQQTKSLKLKDKKGREWALRSVDKDVEKAVQPHLRKTLVKKVVQDMVSASHPYAPLTMSVLAKAAGVVAPNPVLYYVPDDPNFGEFREMFANTVCMLEEREPTPDNTDTEDTDEVLEDLMKDNDHMVMQEQVLRARLLDMLVADWDRHADQWKWGKVDSGDTKYYYVIPRDRDFAYFNSGGLLVKIVSTFSIPHMRGFTAESKALKKLNTKTWFFDHNFLNELDSEKWKRIIAQFQHDISDSVITAAVRRIPPEVYAISGREIEEKLRSRRDGLMKNGLKYYEWLAKSVHVMGTDKADYFRVTESGNDLAVAIYQYKDNKPGRLMYQRIFKRDETDEIHLQGFGDDDHFEIDSNVSSKILLRVAGGGGSDSLSKGNGRIKNKSESIEHEKNSNLTGISNR